MRPSPLPSPRQRPVTRHDGYGGAVRYGDRLCPTISANCFTATFKKSSARVMRRAAEQRLRTSIPKTACCMYRPAYLGLEALDKFAGDLRATHPHFVYTSHGEAQALHNAGRLAWGSGPRGEAPEYTGMDVIIVRDGKIAALYVFLDSIPS